MKTISYGLTDPTIIHLISPKELLTYQSSEIETVWYYVSPAINPKDKYRVKDFWLDPQSETHTWRTMSISFVDGIGNVSIHVDVHCLEIASIVWID